MINSFTGANWFLSNFYPYPIVYEGAIYPSAEHAYQASKSEDDRIRSLFRDSKLTAAAAKSLGQNIVITDQPNWKVRRVFNMRTAIQSKFAPARDLAPKLLDTNDQELFEGNRHGDDFWGTVNGRGENWLGRILMLQREDVRRARQSLF